MIIARGFTPSPMAEYGFFPIGFVSRYNHLNLFCNEQRSLPLTVLIDSPGRISIIFQKDQRPKITPQIPPKFNPPFNSFFAPINEKTVKKIVLTDDRLKKPREGFARTNPFALRPFSVPSNSCFRQPFPTEFVYLTKNGGVRVYVATPFGFPGGPYAGLTDFWGALPVTNGL